MAFKASSWLSEVNEICNVVSAVSDLDFSVLKVWLQGVRVKCVPASGVKFSLQYVFPSFLAVQIHALP